MPVCVEIVHATSTQRFRERLEVAPGTTIGDAVRNSALAWTLDPTSVQPVQVGVFGRLRSITDVVQDGDRIEIYRPLVADPKVGRRRRAARGGIRGGARRD